MGLKTAVTGQSPDGSGAAQAIGINVPTAQFVMLKVIGAGTVFIGGSAVSSANGMEVKAGDGIVGPIPVGNLKDLYFNVAAGTKVAWMAVSP